MKLVNNCQLKVCYKIICCLLVAFLSLNSLTGLSLVSVAEEKDQKLELTTTEQEESEEKRVVATLSEKDMPSFLTLAEAQARGHISRQYEKELSDFTIVFKNLDGSNTLYYSL